MITNLKAKQLASAVYIAIYNRAPEESGLDYWTREIEWGADYSDVINNFTHHPVFGQNYGHLNNNEKVNAFYKNILGERGDADGVQYWTERLDQGDTVGTVLAEFLTASLDSDLNAMGLSAQELALATVRQETLKNKVDASIFYAESMGFWSELSGDVDSLAIQHDKNYLLAAQALHGINDKKHSLTQAKGNIEKMHPFPDKPFTDNKENSYLEDMLQKPIDKIEWQGPNGSGNSGGSASVTETTTVCSGGSCTQTTVTTVGTNSAVTEYYDFFG